MIYAILYDFESRDVLPPATAYSPYSLLGRLVYKDPSSAIEAARSFHDFLSYALDHNYTRLSIYEIYADWEVDTVEVPEVGEEDRPTGPEPAMAMVQELPDEERYLTRMAKIWKLVMEV